MPNLTDEELKYGTDTIFEAVSSIAELKYADIPIDHACGWPTGDEKCGKRIDRVTYFMDDKHIHNAAYCDYHATCMTECVRRLREKEDRMSPEEIEALHQKLMKE